MQKVSYMGDGVTTEFTFNFPYFENSDVVVTENGATATGYNIVGNSAGLDADIPYTGGKVVFDTAPGALDNIVIARSLPLTRQHDYQPTAKIEPTTLNQDMNYLMEVLKDLSDELETLRTQYHDIADKESTTTLLARISAIHDEIVAVSAQITALGDVSQIRSDITTLGTQKANTDMDNLSVDGKKVIDILSAPSDSYTDITEPANNNSTTYTATANGYIYYGRRKTGSDSGCVYIVNQANGIELNAANYLGDTVCTVLMPVKKGDTCILGRKSLTGQLIGCRFYYAIGELTD